MRWIRVSRTCAAGIAIAVSGALAQDLPPAQDIAYLGPITLHVDATDVDRKVLQVRESLPVRPGPLTLLYPEWIPGNHAPTNEVKRLSGLRIGAGGKPLAWQRDPAHLNAVQVEVPAGVSLLEVRFQQLLPMEPKGSASVLMRKIAALEWEGALLYPAGYYASRIEFDASLRLPPGWQHASALRPVARSGDELSFERVPLETLVDSPVFAGRHFKRVDLDPGSARPVILNLFADEATSLEATEAHLEAHRSLVRQADRLFGSRHFMHYDFLLALSDDDLDLGLEHHQSSENSLKAGYFSDWSKTSVGRALLPHEFAHSWNGKFRRPRDLWAADFNAPTRNSLLWVYEGQTEYWGEVLAARAGLIGQEDMRERLARVAAWSHADLGRTWRSVQDTTYDEIISGRQRPLEWPSWQRFLAYYDQGELIWLDVDTKIRELSRGQRSLDDFARGFFGVQDGRVAPLLYDFDDVVTELSRVQKWDWAAFLRARLDAVGADVPLDGLARSGWRLGWTDKQSDYAKAAESYRESTDFAFSLGFIVGKEARIEEVLWDSPAFRAGLVKGPTLLAVNMRAYKAELLSEAIGAARRGSQPIELLIKDGSDYRLLRIDYHDGLRYPRLERIDGTEDRLTAILSAR